ncbi:MAG TPA: ABC transporter permease [Gemmatimonadaceae bacterium]|nr:ABC transporter permease [Gemmatimonadaceae bacterium]
MSDFQRSRPRGIQEHVYRALLHLYPRDFREEFGDAMVEFFRDRLTRTYATYPMAAPFVVWPRVLLDFARNAIPARFDSVVRAVRHSIAAGRTPTIRAARRRDWMLSTILQDARYAIRDLTSRPAFSAIILATLTLGIGATVAIFSVVNGILLRPLPYADPQRLMLLEHAVPYGTVSEPEFIDYKQQARSLEQLAAFAYGGGNLTGEGDEAERIRAVRVSDGFFQILGVSPEVGRAFTPDEDKPGAAEVIILSYGLWQRRYAGDRGIVGQELMLNGRPRTVVGVMPLRFAYPSPSIDVWIPLRLNTDSLWTRNNHYLTVIAKLATNTTFAGAVTELNALGRRWTREYPDTYAPDKPLQVNASLLADSMLGKTRPYLYALLGAVAFVLLIACVNVANLLLVRGETRRKELAVRSALGASRVRLVRQVLTESSLYALVGGALGVLLAWQGVRLLVAVAPSTIPRLDEVRLDLPVLLFSLIASLGTGLLFGLVPALKSAPDASGETLKETGRAGGQARALTRLRRALVISEVALATITLSAAGLMMRSFANMQAIDLGFDPKNILTVRVSLPASEYEGEKSVLLYQMALQRVRALSGVRSAAIVGDLPVRDGWASWSILIDGAPMTSVAAAPSAMPQQVSPGYFETMGIQLVRGRTFSEADRAGAPLVAVVNETMEKTLWPGKSAIGGTVKMLYEKSPWATVVGVVKDVREGGFLSEPPPAMFFPHAQSGLSAYYWPSDMNLVIRTEGSPLRLIGAVRQIVRELEPSAPLAQIQSMDQVVAKSVASRRFSTQLLLGFATVALVLAGIGIYGVIAYGVTQRKFELGLRMALGAQRGSVLRFVLSEGVRLAAVGLAIGIAGAWGVARLMRALFVQVGPGDPITLTSVAVAMAVVALAASWVPARRATIVDPMRAMRAE